jgi:hypothetical protein
MKIFLYFTLLLTLPCTAYTQTHDINFSHPIEENYIHETLTVNSNDIQYFSFIVQNRMLDELCKGITPEERAELVEKYEFFSSISYSDSQLHSSENMEYIDDIILQFTCEAKIHNNAESYQIVEELLTYWISNQVNNNNNHSTYYRRYYLSSSGAYEQVDIVSYIYKSRNIRLAAGIFLSGENFTNPEYQLIRGYLERDLRLINLTDSDRIHVSITYHNTDYMYNFAEGLLAYYAFNKPNDLQYVNRYLRVFLSSKEGDVDGIKPDGVGFHHKFHYTNYMHAYRTTIDILNYLKDTPYQINEYYYIKFRDAVFAMSLMNKSKHELGNIGGRYPWLVDFKVWDEHLFKLMEVGGSILTNDTVNSPDGVLVDKKIASLYYRMTQDEAYQSYFYPQFSSGFWQFNYAGLGLFRDDNWLVGLQGFNHSIIATEMSRTSDGHNLYGRYQGYGALTVMYDGGRPSSGFPTDGNISGWDWNKWPGTTSIPVSWNRLIAEALIDINEPTYEKNARKFAGSLAFSDKSMGLFAMEFQQVNNMKNHDSSFEFNKTYFAINDMVIAVGAGIKNQESEYPTITTLFQNALYNDASVKPIMLDPSVGLGEYISAFPYYERIDNMSQKWLIDAYNTGYLIQSGTSVIISRKTQSVPNRSNKTASIEDISISDPDYQAFTTGDYASAWLNHGYAPTGKGYHYIVIPNATPQKLNQLKNNTNYNLLKNTESECIINFDQNIFAYVIFSPRWIAHGPLHSTSTPLLILTKQTGSNLTVSVSNPDLGYAFRTESSTQPNSKSTVSVTIRGQWQTNSPNINAQVNGGVTILTFDTEHGLAIHIDLQPI